MKDIAIILMVGIMALTMISCASTGGLTDDQKIAAESIVVRAAARNGLGRHPEALPVVLQVCADAEGQSGDVLAALVRKALEDHAVDLASDPYLKDDVEDLVKLLGLPTNETLQGVALKINPEKINALFGAACQGANQASDALVQSMKVNQ